MNPNNQCIVLVPVANRVEPECDESLRALEKMGYHVWRCFGFSAIDQGRNVMAQTALDKGYKELMWIDSDVTFQVSDVEKLRKLELPISCGIYGLKDGSGRPAADLGTNRFFGPGLCEVSMVGAGFLHTRREVYEQIISQQKLPKCNGRHTSYYPFFLPFIDKNQYLGEDFAFCERAKRAGFKIVAAVGIKLGHIGKMVYKWNGAAAPVKPSFSYSQPGLTDENPPDDIAVITCFFNPVGFKNLRNNFDRFHAMLQQWRIPLYVAELTAVGAQPTIQCEHLLHLESDEILWQKEAMLNLLVKQLPEKYTKVAFIDCDMLWEDASFLKEASRKLNLVPVVQLFSQIRYLNANGEEVRRNDGIIKQATNKVTEHGAPGGGWAVHREIFSKFGGLYDVLITGGGDSVHTETGFLGRTDNYLLRTHNVTIQRSMRKWAAPIYRYVRGQVDYVDMVATHLYHGTPANRRYEERKALVKDFDPDRDLVRRDNGLLGWSPQASPLLIDGLKQYFLDRREDD